MDSVLQRLENVTSRLEKIAQASELSAPSTSVKAPSAASSAPAPVSRAAPKPAGAPAAPAGVPAAPTGSAASLSAANSAFSTLCSENIANLERAAKSLDPEVQKATACLTAALQATQALIGTFATTAKPDAAQLQALVKPVGDQLMAASELTRGPRSKWANHAKVVAESIQAFAWVAYTGPTCGMSPPSAYVSECWSSAELYANKVLVEFKRTAPEHGAWVGAVKAVFTELQQFVSAHFPGGPVWSPTGAAAAPAAPAPSAPAPAAAPSPAAVPAKKGGPPPAPPPPKPGIFFEKAAEQAAAAPAPAANAFLEELNKKGDSVTAGLRKVTDDMKTKNRTDRSGVVAAGGAAPAAKPPSSAAPAAPTRGPASTKLQQRRWIVENYDCDNAVVLPEDQLLREHSVYIAHCVNSVIQVKGKVNNIMLDNCKKVGLLFEAVVSSCEVVNCASVQLQFTGACPTLAIDKTDGVQVYVNKESLGSTEITTAKSSSINICIQPDNDEDDMQEHPLPEQFVSRYVDGKFVTEALSHSAG